MAEKRVVFKNPWLPYVLLAPQIVVTVLFFFWPAAQAVWQSLLVQDAFGTHTEFVWFDNFKVLFSDSLYLASFRTTAIFSVLVAVIGIGTSLFLAVTADRVLRGALVYFWLGHFHYIHPFRSIGY